MTIKQLLEDSKFMSNLAIILEDIQQRNLHPNIALDEIIELLKKRL